MYVTRPARPNKFLPVLDSHTAGTSSDQRGSRRSCNCGLEAGVQKLRCVLASILMLGPAIPGAVLADNDDDGDRRRCSNIGTWFGVAGLDDSTPTGPSWTVPYPSQWGRRAYIEMP